MSEDHMADGSPAEKPPGRLVLLYFGDEHKAQEFLDTTDARVVGMYEDPKGKECRCKSQRTARTKDFGWGEHHTYWGWQRHSMCKRAGVWWRRNYGRRLFLALGVNLLPREIGRASGREGVCQYV